MLIIPAMLQHSLPCRAERGARNRQNANCKIMSALLLCHVQSAQA